MNFIYLFLFTIFTFLCIGLILYVLFFLKGPAGIALKGLVLFFILPFIISFVLIIKNSYIISKSSDFDISNGNMPIKEIMIFTEDKVMISVWEIISGPDAPCVIFSHGLRSSKENFLNLAGELYKKGYNCFLFDFRGHGVSRGGSISSFGYKEQKDLEAVINYILGNVFFTNKNIGLFGASMGASVSLITAGKYKQVKVVVVDSAYDNLLDSMLINLKLKYKLPIWLFRYPFRLAYTARFLKDPKNISPEKALETMENKAVFFLNGGKDLKNPAEKAVKMFSLFKGQKKIWVLPEAGHMQAVSLNFEEYKTKVLDFFCKYLNKKIL